MKRIIRLTERDLTRIVKRVIRENNVTTQTTTVSNLGGGGGEEENVYAKREVLNKIVNQKTKVIGNQYPSGYNTAANNVDNKNGTINFYTTETSKANKNKAYLRKYIVTCSNPVSINNLPYARWSDEKEYYETSVQQPVNKAKDMATGMCKVFYPNNFLK